MWSYETTKQTYFRGKCYKMYHNYRTPKSLHIQLCRNIGKLYHILHIYWLYQTAQSPHTRTTFQPCCHFTPDQCIDVTSGRLRRLRIDDRTNCLVASAGKWKQRFSKLKVNANWRPLQVSEAHFRMSALRKRKVAGVDKHLYLLFHHLGISKDLWTVERRELGICQLNISCRDGSQPRMFVLLSLTGRVTQNQILLISRHTPSRQPLTTLSVVTLAGSPSSRCSVVARYVLLCGFYLNLKAFAECCLFCNFWWLKQW